MFRIGQKVVCVSVEMLSGKPNPLANYPVVRGIYTVRDIFPWMNKTLLLLDEIDNRHIMTVVGEPGFTSTHFRPVVERKTDTGFAVLEDIRKRESIPANERVGALLTSGDQASRPAPATGAGR